MVIKNYFSLLLLVCTVLCASSAAAVSDSPAVDVQQSLKNAFAYSPNLQMMQEAREQATHNVRAAEAGYYPTIGAWAGGGVFQESTLITRDAEDEGKVLGNTNAGINLSQTIWQGGATAATVRSREALLEASIFYVLDNATALAYSAISAHVDLIRRKEIVVLATNNMLYTEKILNMLKIRFREGLSSEGDVQQVLGRLHKAKATLALHKEGLSNAHANYRRITGQDAPMNLLSVSMPDLMYNNTDTIRDLTVQHNYNLKAIIAQINSLIGERDFARSVFSPAFTLDGGPSYQNIDRGVGGDTYELSWNLMLNMRWNLYNGGADMANFAANSAKIREARKSLQATMDTLEEQISVSYARTMTATENAVNFTKASEASAISRDNFLIQFRAGKKDLLNVLDAETEFFSSSVEAVIGKTDSVLGHYRMHSLAGTLLETLNIDSNSVSMGKPVPAAVDVVEPWDFSPSPLETSPSTSVQDSTLQRD